VTPFGGRARTASALWVHESPGREIAISARPVGRANRTSPQSRSAMPPALCEPPNPPAPVAEGKDAAQLSVMLCPPRRAVPFEPRRPMPWRASRRIHINRGGRRSAMPSPQHRYERDLLLQDGALISPWRNIEARVLSRLREIPGSMLRRPAPWDGGVSFIRRRVLALRGHAVSVAAAGEKPSIHLFPAAGLRQALVGPQPSRREAVQFFPSRCIPRALGGCPCGIRFARCHIFFPSQRTVA